MSDITSAGQDAPVVIDQATTTGAAQTTAATTDAATGAADGGEASQVTPKTYTEEEHRDAIERATAKAAAKAERRAFREATQRLASQQVTQPQQTSQPANDGKPTRAQYADEDAFVDALTDWKLDQRDRVSAHERQRQQAQSLTQKTDAIYAQAQKVAGFDREAFDDLPLTKPIVEALVDSDMAPQLMAYMASHPEDVARIAQLTPARQAAELGKLEAKAAEKPPVKPSKAPDPITPIGSGKTPVHDLASADMDTYMEMRKKQNARWAR